MRALGLRLSGAAIEMSASFLKLACGVLEASEDSSGALAVQSARDVKASRRLASLSGRMTVILAVQAVRAVGRVRAHKRWSDAGSMLTVHA